MCIKLPELNADIMKTSYCRDVLAQLFPNLRLVNINLNVIGCKFDHSAQARPYACLIQEIALYMNLM